MSEEQAQMPLKPVIAGILCAQLVTALAVATYMALNPPAGEVGGLSINLIAIIAGPAFALTVPIGVPLMLLARRNLRDPGLSSSDWAGTGVYAGFIGGGLGGVVFLLWATVQGGFEALMLLLVAGFALTGMIVGAIMGFVARPVSRYFVSRAA